jgi:hypothetical protein
MEGFTMSDMKSTILEKLAKIESKHGIKIIHAIESGSRGWGFAAKDADYDCRFIYVHPKDWYLTVQDKKDFIEAEQNEVFDIKGVDIKRAMKYITKPDCSIYEWLSSNEIYICNENIVKQLKNLTAAFFNPVPLSWHYLSLAKKMVGDIDLADEAKIKKYFYVLRPIVNLNYIAAHGNMPYMEYVKTLAESNTSIEIRKAIDELLTIKLASDEHYKIPKNQLLVDYFKAEIEKFEESLKTMTQSKNRNYEQVDEVFRKVIEGAWND